MPRARLTGGSWQFEGDALASIRHKIVHGRRTLRDVVGAPKSGIKTGLTPAFCIADSLAMEIVTAEPKSKGLIHPYLRGDDIARWLPEPSSMHMIVIPNGWTRQQLLTGTDANQDSAWRQFSAAHPQLSKHLLAYKERGQSRSDQGEYWWELRPCDYYDQIILSKIVYPEMSQGPKFAIDENGRYINNKCFFLPAKTGLAAYLNSHLFWFWAFGEVSPLRGGQWRLELREQHMSHAPVSIDLLENEEVRRLEISAQCATKARFSRLTAFHHRLLTDLAAPGARLSRKLENFHDLSFAEFRDEVKKALKAEIPLKERAQWEALHAEASAEVKRLAAEIAAAEREIDRLVYEAFELTPDEIALLEKSLDGQV